MKNHFLFLIFPHFGLCSRWGSVKALSLKEVSGQTERFDSFTTHKNWIGNPTAEVIGQEPIKCEFESHSVYNKSSLTD